MRVVIDEFNVIDYTEWDYFYVCSESYCQHVLGRSVKQCPVNYHNIDDDGYSKGHLIVIRKVTTIRLDKVNNDLTIFGFLIKRRTKIIETITGERWEGKNEESVKWVKENRPLL